MRELGDIDAELVAAVWDVARDNGALPSSRRVDRLLDERMTSSGQPTVPRSPPPYDEMATGW